MYELAKLIVTPEQKPTTVVQKVAELTGVMEAAKQLNLKASIDLKTLIDITQKPEAQWLRPADAERDVLKPVFTERAKELMKLFQELRMCEQILPQAKEFKYGLIMGSTADSILARMQFLENLIEKNDSKIHNLVLLTGQRALNVGDAQEEKFLKTVLNDITGIHTETDMAKALISKTDMFPNLKKHSLTIVDTKADACNNRPRTSNTVIDWLALKPESGSCLAVSSNPFIAYQDLTLRTLLPETFTLETCGPRDPFLEEETSAGLIISLCLDSLARWIFQHDKWFSKASKKHLHS